MGPSVPGEATLSKKEAATRAAAARSAPGARRPRRRRERLMGWDGIEEYRDPGGGRRAAREGRAGGTMDAHRGLPGAVAGARKSLPETAHGPRALGRSWRGPAAYLMMFILLDRPAAHLSEPDTPGAPEAPPRHVTLRPPPGRPSPTPHATRPAFNGSPYARRVISNTPPPPVHHEVGCAARLLLRLLRLLLLLPRRLLLHACLGGCR